MCSALLGTLFPSCLFQYMFLPFSAATTGPSQLSFPLYLCKYAHLYVNCIIHTPLFTFPPPWFLLSVLEVQFWTAVLALDPSICWGYMYWLTALYRSQTVYVLAVVLLPVARHGLCLPCLPGCLLGPVLFCSLVLSLSCFTPVNKVDNSRSSSF